MRHFGGPLSALIYIGTKTRVVQCASVQSNITKFSKTHWNTTKDSAKWIASIQVIQRCSKTFSFLAPLTMWDNYCESLTCQSVSESDPLQYKSVVDFILQLTTLHDGEHLGAVPGLVQWLSWSIEIPREGHSCSLSTTQYQSKCFHQASKILMNWYFSLSHPKCELGTIYLKKTSDKKRDL